MLKLDYGLHKHTFKADSWLCIVIFVGMPFPYEEKGIFYYPFLFYR